MRAAPRSRTKSARGPRPIAAAGALAALLAAAPAFAESAPPPAADVAPPDGVTEVRVERVRPAHEKLPTLRFLRENRDFLRAQFDLLKEAPVTGHGDARPIDPRFLAYGRLMNDARAAEDSTVAAVDASERQALLASITQLGTLESQLDQLERMLAAQRERLGILETDFTGRQQTALMVLLSGSPSGDAPASVALRLDDADPVAIELSPEQRESLRHGGMIQLFHGFVEPREQVIAVSLGGGAWPANRGYVTLEPERDQLTFLRLDLAAADPAQGAAGIAASTWRLDSGSATAPR
jgi:hypothetical protein